MADEFSAQDLSGARFHWVDLTGATFDHVRLAGATLQQVDLSRVKVRAALLDGLDISGDVQSVRINDVEVGPLIDAELDRRHPERTKLRPTDADGYRAAWPVVEQLWSATVDRARRLDPDLLHERVDGEWSFIETQRHLLFATDAWIGRVLLGEPSPWHPLDLPFDELPDTPGVPRDREARPPIDEVLALRNERMAIVAQVLADLTDDQLAGSTEPVDEDGWPRPDRYPVRGVLDTILDEEWWHHRFANRDLDRLTTSEPPASI